MVNFGTLLGKQEHRAAVSVCSLLSSISLYLFGFFKNVLVKLSMIKKHNLTFHFTTRSRGQQIVCTSTVPMCIFEEDTQDKLACWPLGGEKLMSLWDKIMCPAEDRETKAGALFSPIARLYDPRGNVPIVEIPLRRKLISTICHFIFLMRQQENTGGDFAHVQRQN